MDTRGSRPAIILCSRLVNQTERHWLKSGVAGYQVGEELLSMHFHFAKPVVPPGHGWMSVELTFVQFQTMLRTVLETQRPFVSESLVQDGSRLVAGV
jgi:hypothetical protein